MFSFIIFDWSNVLIMDKRLRNGIFLVLIVIADIQISAADGSDPWLWLADPYWEPLYKHTHL